MVRQRIGDQAHILHVAQFAYRLYRYTTLYESSSVNL